MVNLNFFTFPNVHFLSTSEIGLTILWLSSSNNIVRVIGCRKKISTETFEDVTITFHHVGLFNSRMIEH